MSEGPGTTRKTLVMAALLFAGLWLLAFFMPAIMLKLGETSPWIAMLAAAGFLVLPFAVLAWRARVQNRQKGD